MLWSQERGQTMVFEFFPEQKMTRAEAIHAYTLGNAFAAFEENIKGSISIGKVADFVILQMIF